MILSPFRPGLTGAMLLLTAALAPAASAQKKPVPKTHNISGNWVVTGTAPTDTVKSTAVFKQEGTTVTGTFTIPLVGAGTLSGAVRGDSVAFTIPFVLQGKPVEVRVDGLIKDNKTIGGVVKLPNNGLTYPFIARRQP